MMTTQPHPSTHQPDMSLPRVFAALAEPLRLQIVRRLVREEKLSCGQIDHHLSLSTVSHHCKVLREAGIVASQPVGNQRILMLRPEFVAQYSGLIDSIMTHEV